MFVQDSKGGNTRQQVSPSSQFCTVVCKRESLKEQLSDWVSLSRKAPGPSELPPKPPESPCFTYDVCRKGAVRQGRSTPGISSQSSTWLWKCHPGPILSPRGTRMTTLSGRPRGPGLHPSFIHSFIQSPHADLLCARYCFRHRR